MLRPRTCAAICELAKPLDRKDRRRRKALQRPAGGGPRRLFRSDHGRHLPLICLNRLVYKRGVNQCSWAQSRSEVVRVGIFLASPDRAGGRLRLADRAVSRRRSGGGRADGGRPGRAGAGILGPAPPAGKARFVPHQRDPVPHRDRLPALQFCRAGRQSAGLQCRSSAPALRGAQGRLYDPDAPLRDAHCSAQRQSGRCPIASIAVTLDLRTKVDFTDSYYRTPARFVAKRDSPIDDPLPERLEGKKVAVVAGTAHEAYLKALFTEAEVRAYPSADLARLALRRGDVDLLFGDAISLAFWLNGTDSES